MTECKPLKTVLAGRTYHPIPKKPTPLKTTTNNITRGGGGGSHAWWHWGEGGKVSSRWHSDLSPCPVERVKLHLCIYACVSVCLWVSKSEWVSICVFMRERWETEKGWREREREIEKGRDRETERGRRDRDRDSVCVCVWVCVLSGWGMRASGLLEGALTPWVTWPQWPRAEVREWLWHRSKPSASSSPQPAVATPPPKTKPPATKYFAMPLFYHWLTRIQICQAKSRVCRA